MITAYSNHFYIAYRRLGKNNTGNHSHDLAPNFALTDIERDVLTWIARGKSYHDVSVMLKMSSHTVDYHFRSIFKKLEVNDRVLAVVKALTYGLIHP